MSRWATDRSWYEREAWRFDRRLMRPAWMLLAVLVVAGCGNVNERGDRLVAELEAAFPERISAVSFESNFLDPPNLFIDIDPPMEPEAERRFLCDEIRPMIDAAGGGIDATTSYGWYMSEECPSPSLVFTQAIELLYVLPALALGGGVFPLLLVLAVVPLVLISRRRSPGLTAILTGVLAVLIVVLMLNVFFGTFIGFI